LAELTGNAVEFCRQAVRRGDLDRYLAALFAPSSRRDSVLSLAAFNLEIARAREQVSEPMLGLIRLQWWREALDEIFGGRPVRKHPVAEMLAASFDRYQLPRDPFDRLVSARERDMQSEPFPDLPALEVYAGETTTPLLALTLAIVAPDRELPEAALRDLGIGYALTGLIRAIPFHAAAGRVYLPQDWLDAASLSVHQLQDRRAAPDRRAAVVRDIAARARERVDRARGALQGLPRSAAPVRLAGTIAGWHLDRLAAAQFDPHAPEIRASPPWTVWRLGWRNLLGRY
jgi:phytoene synthase